mgnify:CR=1 FL=1
MSNISIQSQENSSLYNSAKQGAGVPMGNVDKLVYDMEAPDVNAFRSRENKTQILGCAMNGTFQAEIPSFGVWRECYLKFNVSWKNGTNNLSPTISDALGANIITSARIMSNSRTIYELTSAEIQYLIYTDKDAGRREGRKKAMKNMMQDQFTGAVANTPGGVTVPLKWDALDGVVDVAGTAGHNYLASDAQVLQCHDVYCPLPFSCFQDMKSNIDTSFTEKLVLEIKTNEAHLAVSGGTGANNVLVSAFTINKAEVCNEFLVIEQDAKKAIQSKNYSLGGSPLAILGSDFKNKSVQVTADSVKTTASLNLFFTELCHGILFEVQPVRTLATLGAITGQFVGVAEAATLNKGLQPFTRALASTGQTKGGRFIHCNKITIKAGGKLIYEGSHDEIRNLNGSSPMCLNVNGDVETAHEEDVVYASCYNLYYVNFANSHMTTAIKGALALRNLNSIVCEVEYPSVSGIKYNVTAHLRHYVARSIDGASGAISAALSN